MDAMIICNGTILDYPYYHKYFKDGDLIMSVDGGAAHVRKLGIRPHLLLGDFDSIEKSDFAYFEKLGIEIEQFPIEKDMTDTELAIEIAVQRGCEAITIIGGIGTRMDHSLSNIYLLKKILDSGLKGRIVNEHNEMMLMTDHITLQKEEGRKVSLLPLTEKVEGITTTGLYYPLSNATIEIGSSRGVSNEYADDIATVTIKKGILLVILSRD